MLAYLIFIFVVFICLALLGFFNFNEFKISNGVFYFVIAVLLGLISYRPEIVNDTTFYREYFLEVPIKNFVSFLLGQKYEYGLIIIMVLVKMVVGNSYNLFFLAVTIINLLIVINASKLISSVISENEEINSKRYHILIVVLYFAYYGFMYNMSPLRGGVGLSLSILSIAYWVKGYRFRSILLWAGSILFHKIFVFAFFIYLILLTTKKSRSNWFYYRFVILIFIIQLVGFRDLLVSKIDVIFNLFHHYVSDRNFSGYLNDEYNKEWSYRTLLFLFNAFFFIANRNGSIVYDKILRIYLFGFTINLLFMNLFRSLSRFTDMFTVVEIFLMFYILITSRNLIIKNTYYFMFILLNLLFFLRLSVL